MEQRHYFFSGKVQGVFFRATTRNFCQELGVSGWVKNLPDGRVEAVLQGDKEKLDALQKKLSSKYGLGDKGAEVAMEELIVVMEGFSIE